MDTADHAKAIRTALKGQKITGRQVSVRTDRYSMGSSIRITIKDAAVSKDAVEAIAAEHEDVRRDEHGEILNGGNRFVFVDYDYDALVPVRDAIRDDVIDICIRVTTIERDSIVPVTGNIGVSFDTWGDRFKVWTLGDGNCIGSGLYNADEVIDRIARRIATVGDAAELLAGVRSANAEYDADSDWNNSASMMHY